MGGGGGAPAPPKPRYLLSPTAIEFQKKRRQKFLDETKEKRAALEKAAKGAEDLPKLARHASPKAAAAFAAKQQLDKLNAQTPKVVFSTEDPDEAARIEADAAKFFEEEKKAQEQARKDEVRRRRSIAGAADVASIIQGRARKRANILRAAISQDKSTLGSTTRLGVA